MPTFKLFGSATILPACLAIVSLIAPRSVRAQQSVTVAPPDSVHWSPPANGLSVAVLEGDPSRTGPYAMLMRLDAGAWIPEHFHNVAKRVVVISGVLLMRHAAAGAGTSVHRLGAGGFAIVPPDRVHAEGADGATVFLLIGEGPLRTTFVPQVAKPSM